MAEGVGPPVRWPYPPHCATCGEYNKTIYFRMEGLMRFWLCRQCYPFHLTGEARRSVVVVFAGDADREENEDA